MLSGCSQGFEARPRTKTVIVLNAGVTMKVLDKSSQPYPLRHCQFGLRLKSLVPWSICQHSGRYRREPKFGGELVDWR